MMDEECRHRTDRLARGLGWASLGLAAIQVAAPRAVRRAAGVDDSRAAGILVPAAGVRELAHAVFLLGSRDPGRWVWTRVAGDAVDLAALGRAVARRCGSRRRRAAAATAVVAGITAVDLYAMVRRRTREHEMVVRAAITVRRPREEVYRFWRHLENLPRFMIHLRSVTVLDDIRSEWTATAPAGRATSWTARIMQDRPGELIAWRTSEDATVPNHGTVRFADAPGGRGTEVRVEIRYEPPGGAAGQAVARLLGEHPDQQVHDDLRRFKQVMETGEVVRSEGSPEGVRAMRQVRQRPARPVMTGGAT